MRGFSSEDLNRKKYRKGPNLEHGQGEKIGCNDDLSSELMNLLGNSLPVLDLSVDVGVLEHGSAEVLSDDRIGEELGRRSNDDVELESFGSSVKDREGLGRLQEVEEGSQNELEAYWARVETKKKNSQHQTKRRRSSFPSTVPST